MFAVRILQSAVNKLFFFSLNGLDVPGDSHKREGDSRQEIKIKCLRENNMGVARPVAIAPVKC